MYIYVPLKTVINKTELVYACSLFRTSLELTVQRKGLIGENMVNLPIETFHLAICYGCHC